MNQTWAAIVTLLALLLATPLGAAAQESLEELAKKTQNPVADQIKLQVQNYFNFGMGTNNVTQYDHNDVLTIPLKLTDDWNLITRTDLPIINQPSLAPGTESAFGLGDLSPTLYLSPRKPSALEWGVGPSLTFPTATARSLGFGKWGAGPAAVVVTVQGPWVIGTRINNMWSFAGWGEQAINEMWLQPFAHYNFRRGWYLASLPTITANWKASSGNVWTVPLGGGLGKHLRVGKRSMDLQLQAFRNVERPAGAAPWQLLFEVQVVSPKGVTQSK